jgi:ubiquitin-conjugating enzyme E2 variant
VQGLGLFTSIAVVAIQLFGVFLLADMTSGFVHWLEDNYGEENWPIIGQTVIAPNLLHHSKPRAFLQNNWWQSADYLVCIGLVILLIACLANTLSWQLMAYLVVAANGNETHKWAHRGSDENRLLTRALQRLRLLLPPEHHSRHHVGKRNTHYCTISPLVNPLLDQSGFWRGLEYCIYRLTGAIPRDNSVNAVQSPLPTRPLDRPDT